VTASRTAHASLLRLAAEARPWSQAEEEFQTTCGDGMLGGDPLRPYFAHVTDSQVTVSAVRRPGLPDPPLITDLLSGRYSQPVIRDGATVTGGMRCPDAVVADIHLAASPALSARLVLPRVLLIGLGDRDRYRGARLPLGVARLASWLRFTHAARVQVLDYSLLDGEPADAITQSLNARPDVIGVGVNFGQWQMLAGLAQVIEHGTASWPASPVIVLGNILAAFSPREAAAPFSRARAGGKVLIATGLGEHPMQAVCRALDKPESWARIPGLVSASARATRNRTGTGPDGLTLATAGTAAVPPLVAPDDALVLAVAGEQGQVSLETSLGCQYGACTFCPRTHKGAGWERNAPEVCAAILERWSRVRPPAAPAVTVSLVDEEFFGAEGLQDPPLAELPAARILACLQDLNLKYELYTRLEQLFDRRKSREWNLRRARLLAEAAQHMRRLFAGVESGSSAQLRRYGKGQTLTQTVDALRVASALGVPLEFGFITFDPLLTPAELGENIAFLARTDVICRPDARDPVSAAGNYLDGADLPASGEPVYRHVAYMATELEVLAHSRYASQLRRRHPELVGSYDPAFCRFGVSYADAGIAAVASWCRVWTEGMFTPVYQARMAVRSVGHDRAGEAQALVRRYRDATFTLLRELTRRYLPDVNLGASAQAAGPVPAGTCDEMALLAGLSAAVTGHRATFDPRLLERRRDR